MGKVSFGWLYVNPPLSEEESRALSDADFGSLSFSQRAADQLGATPPIDGGEQDLQALVAMLRGWNKSIYMNDLHYSDSNYGDEWMVIDGNIQSYHWSAVPDYVKPWLIRRDVGGEPSVRCRISIHTMHRLVARILHALNLGTDDMVTELKAIGDDIPDSDHAQAVFSELNGVACRDWELSELHWLDWRVRNGVLGLLAARVALRNALEFPKTEYESSCIDGWLDEDVVSLSAEDLAPFFIAAARLERRAAVEFLLDVALSLRIQPPPEPFVLRVAMETDTDWEAEYTKLFRLYDFAGVVCFLPQLVAVVDEKNSDVHRLLEWHAYMCREEEPEAFAEAVEREPKLTKLAEAGGVW